MAYDELVNFLTEFFQGYAENHGPDYDAELMAEDLAYALDEEFGLTEEASGLGSEEDDE